MKKYIYILPAIAALLVGCTNMDEMYYEGKERLVLNIYNSPMTKATDPGEDYERQLDRLDCFFYTASSDADTPCVYYQKVTPNTVGQAEIPFYVDDSVIEAIFGTGTTCNVFVIANNPDAGATYSAGADGTDVTSLSQMVLELDGSYDAEAKSFVMAGYATATKDDKGNAEGTIPLSRAAAKITVQVRVPEWITVTEVVGDTSGDNTTSTPQDVKYYPSLESTLKTSFFNGVSKTYLKDDYSAKITEADLMNIGPYGYTYNGLTAGADADTPGYYTLECEMPFYSYARSWAKGDVDAPYLTLEIPWGKDADGDGGVDTYITYYYQILVNAGGLCLEANHWYDLTVNVGVLGSLIESLPTEITENTTYYILDWTTEPDPAFKEGGDRYEDVIMKEWMYLIVPETRIIINNASTGIIGYDASHKIGWMMNTDSKEVEILPGENTTLSAFYINCSSSTPSAKSLSINTSNFTDDGKGNLTYNYEIPSTVYSPVYVYITVWLDLDGDGVLDTGTKEAEFQENITIVQYPPIYIIPDQSCEKSVYVNGKRESSTNITFTQGDGSGSTVRLGSVKGYSSGNFMYIITVSSFAEDDTFSLESGSSYNYIIGDPRQIKEDNNLHDTYTFTDDWVKAPATYPNSEYENGAWTNTRSLTYYYPTSTDAAAFQIIAPKFRVVSFNSTVGDANNVDKEGAPLRCASYQEDGFPAGRWRVPTAAEINYIISLQKANAIVDIFVGTTDYFCSTGTVSVDNGYKTTETDGSVRCVYDEWYWGSEREAKKNPNGTTGAANEYLFTWGDEPR